MTKNTANSYTEQHTASDIRNPLRYSASMEQDESQLIARYLTGDDAALETLIAQYLPRVYAFVFRLVKDEQDAADISQKVFIKVWQAFSSYNTDRPFAPWLFTIARRMTIDHVRGKKAISFSSLDDVEEGRSYESGIPDVAPLPDEVLERKELAHELEAALGQLTVEQRTIILLHLYEHLTFEEIGDVVGKPMNTVKSIYRRSLGRLRELLV